jgi:hypothetical protein
MASACQPVFMPPILVNKDLAGNPEQSYQYVDGGVREYAGINMAIDNGATNIFTILLSPEGTDLVEKPFDKLFGILQRTIDIFTMDVGKNDLLIPAIYNDALKYIDGVKKKMTEGGISPAQIESFFNTQGTENPFAGKKPLNIYIIRPDTPLGGGPGGLVFDPAEMKTMVSRGEMTAGTFIAKLNRGELVWA